MKAKKTEYVEEQGSILEPDVYPATVTGFGEYEGGKFGPQIVWQFEVEHDGEAVEAAGFTSFKFTVGKMKSKAVKWYEAITGDEFPDEEFDLEEHLVEMPCRVDIENYTKESGITKNSVVGVKPAKKGQKEAAPTNGKEEIDLNSEDFDDLPF